jgi:hypothetical protein
MFPERFRDSEGESQCHWLPVFASTQHEYSTFFRVPGNALPQALPRTFEALTDYDMCPAVPQEPRSPNIEV